MAALNPSELLAIAAKVKRIKKKVQLLGNKPSIDAIMSCVSEVDPELGKVMSTTLASRKISSRHANCEDIADDDLLKSIFNDPEFEKGRESFEKNKDVINDLLEVIV